MPVYRTPDGKIVEEKTKMTRDSGPASERPTTLDGDGVAGRGGAESRFDNPTVVSGQGAGNRDTSGPAPHSSPNQGAPSAGSSVPPAGGNPGKTRLAGTGASSPTEDTVQQEIQSGAEDPVSGWLVVVDGPGRGRYAAVGVGRNSVGRDASERVSLDFGDGSISRQGHIVITYDHRGRQFFVQPGQGQNLTYIDDKPILDTVPLVSGTELAVGGSRLKFVAFCGPDFDWADED